LPEPRRLLVLSGGHPYEAGPFAELLASVDWEVTHLVHPEAEGAVAEGALAQADAALFYDMPGYTFAHGRVETTPPSPGFIAAIRTHFAGGKGAVAMHHALAGWAEWPEWAEMLGGRFLYQPDEVRGEEMLDSGYRHDVAYEAEVLADHPVTAGLPATFTMCDELYLAQVFANDVTPLIRARHAFIRENFYSAAQAVAGAMFSNAGWDHPPGSDLIAWTRPVGAGQLVYLQPGDGPATYASPHLRRLLANALDYVTPREA
jgi:hypothetical protein